MKTLKRIAKQREENVLLKPFKEIMKGLKTQSKRRYFVHAYGTVKKW